MSDPVKNVEIEDVLSSIRRLLADGEGQGQSRPETAPQESAARSSVVPARVRSERRGDAPLVLTPALRVAGRPEAKTPAPAATPLPAPAGPREVPKNDMASDADEDFEPTDLAAASNPRGPTLRSRLEETIAELEAAITHQAGEWEPDGSEPAPVMDWSSARAEDAPFLSRRHGPAATPPAAPEPEASETAAPAAESEAQEAPEAGYHDGLAQEDAFAPAEDRASAPAREEASEPGAVPGLDEEMLRRLITEVLREELRGPLGDRITSNLRKLVRREIFRALASDSFE